MIAVRNVRREEAAKVGEIDRTERITTGYTVRHGVLVAGAVDWHAPAWHADGDGPYSVGHYRLAVEQVLDEGGEAFGAFEGNRLLGCATLRYWLTPESAQLAGMWVSAGHRRTGIGTRLLSRVVRAAEASGARELYVSAMPSESAVGFYMSRGFALAPSYRLHPELYALEPEDIHMIRPL